MIRPSAEKYCVIGAGSSGLAVAKNFRQLGLPFDCFEREDDIGGNWYYGKPHSSVYQSTHLISSKPLTEYTDFPMPREYPDYPHQRQVWDYLRAYAERFDLYSCIEFNTAVTDVTPIDGQWEVTLADGRRRRYRGIVIANGHNWDPQRPSFTGTFNGQSLHSAEYKTPDVLMGRRVLVVGGGNSGCDIAVEAAQHAARTFHSVRRGYHYLPKYLSGKPADQAGERLLRWGLPLWVRRMIASAMLRIAVGKPERYGFPRPDHKLFETHPIINSQLLYYVGHGRITMKPDVAELCGDSVRFVDGSVEAIDTIVYATGFKISFPFIDQKHLNWRDGRPDLYLNVFHPEHDTLCVAGLIQPDSGQWGLVDCQAQLIARFFHALDRDPVAAERFRRKRARSQQDLGGGIRYIRSPRHLLEVEHYSYRRQLQKLIAQFGNPSTVRAQM
jgi:cation diffusion facilitator CzcD-associated flavoprotein CzcO